MQQLKQYFEKIGFAGDDLDKILQSFVVKSYGKNDFFAEVGKTNKYLGFIESGMMRYYVIKEGEERTTYIALERSFVVSLYSFLQEKPSFEYIQALVDTQVYVLSKTALRTLQNELPAFKNFYIGLLESAICGIDDTRHGLIVLTAEQRYEKMLREEPHLLQQIPLQYLASILGVTPRHLSRIRQQIR